MKFDFEIGDLVNFLLKARQNGYAGDGKKKKNQKDQDSRNSTTKKETSNTGTATQDTSRHQDKK